MPPAIPSIPDRTGRVRRELFPGDEVEPLKLPDPEVAHVLLVHVEVDPEPRVLRRALAAVEAVTVPDQRGNVRFLDQSSSSVSHGPVTAHCHSECTAGPREAHRPRVTFPNTGPGQEDVLWLGREPGCCGG